MTKEDNVTWEGKVDYRFFDNYPEDLPEAIIMALRKKPRTREMLKMKFAKANVKGASVDTAIMYLFGRAQNSPYSEPIIESKRINGKTWYGLLPKFRKTKEGEGNKEIE